MDPSIMKQILEDEEDETMHSKADLEAFQAALNWDIEGDVSSSQPFDPDSTVLSQGNYNTLSQSLPQLSTSSQDEIIASQIQQDQKIAQNGEMELKQQGSIAENIQQKKDASQELNHFPLPQKQPPGDLQQGQAEEKLLQITENTGIPISGKNPSSTQEQGISPNLKSDSQYLKLQMMSSQQSMITEQPRNLPDGSKQVPFTQILPLLKPQLDEERGMQLTALFGRLRSNEIRKEAFIRKLKRIVGDEMLIAAAKRAESLPCPKFRIRPWPSVQQQPPRMPSISPGSTQLHDPRSFALHLRGAKSSTEPSHIPPSTVQVQTDSRHPVIENSARKLPEAECHSDSHGMQVSVISSSSAVASNQEKECSSVPMHGNIGGTCHSNSGTNLNTGTLPVKLQPPDAQLRHIPQHQSMGSPQSGGEAHGMNIMSVSKMERRNSMNDSGRLQGGSLSHFTNNAMLQQSPVPRQFSNKDQNSSPLSSMDYVKQDSIDQTAEQQHKSTLPNSQGLPSVSAALLEQGTASSGILRDESLEKLSSRMSVSTSPSSTSTVPSNSVSPSIMMQVNPSVSFNPRITFGTSPSGINNKTPPKKPSIGQKKPLEALRSSSRQSFKKQKVSGAFSDIDQLNDVTAVSGVNLREEEEQLFSGPKADSRASKASQKFVREEERLILQKSPLQRKLAKIMVKYGLKTVSHDVDRCLSLCVGERMRGLINRLIRLSKQRVDAEKSRHHTITTSDVRQQIMDLNRRAREEWGKKQVEAEKLRRLNEPELDNGVDGDKEKDEGHPKSFKTNKEEDDKMRTKAANVAARAAVGGDDMFSKWQLMAQARQKREGEIDAASGSQPGQGVNRKPTSTAGRIMDSQEAGKRGGAAHVAAAGTIGKSGGNQVIVPQTRMDRSISVKDMITVLEREPQMSKSTLMYRLHERIQSDTAVE